MLQRIGVAAAALTILDNCAANGSSLPTAKSSTCGTGTCIDLGDPANQALTKVDGALLIDHANDTVMVIRTSDTAAIALSAICTHAGCSMDFDAGAHHLVCPCHDSVFAETGDVLSGPARRPLRVYTASLANNTITVT